MMDLHCLCVLVSGGSKSKAVRTIHENLRPLALSGSLTRSWLLSVSSKANATLLGTFVAVLSEATFAIKSSFAMLSCYRERLFFEKLFTNVRTPKFCDFDQPLQLAKKRWLLRGDALYPWI
jgi:hypothetical protein